MSYCSTTLRGHIHLEGSCLCKWNKVLTELILACKLLIKNWYSVFENRYSITKHNIAILYIFLHPYYLWGIRPLTRPLYILPFILLDNIKQNVTCFPHLVPFPPFNQQTWSLLHSEPSKEWCNIVWYQCAALCTHKFNNQWPSYFNCLPTNTKKKKKKKR